MCFFLYMTAPLRKEGRKEERIEANKKGRKGVKDRSKEKSI